MKRSKRFLIVVAIVLVVSALMVTSALAARDPFIGAWESIDTDGSYQVLRIGGGPGNTHQVRYYDYGASICDDLLGTTGLAYAARVRARMSHSGDTLSGNFSVYCQTSPPTFAGDFPISYTYDSVDDTLTDNFGTVWNRR